MNSNKFSLPKRYRDCETNVWMEYSDLARRFKPLNLGQGAPDFAPPQILQDALKEVSNSNDPLLHQYTRGFGHPRLVNVLSKIYSPLFNREIDPMNEVMVANGGTEALYCAILGLVEEQDEVIIMEPFFDCFEYFVRMAGGVPKYIPLKMDKNASSANDLKFCKNELQNLFNSKTKMIIVNSPHNPTGKVFALDELQFIADLCVKYDVLCLADEVYEWIVYENCQHLRIATLPKMWDRTITIGSAGKTFSATGWKIGWAFGPNNLLKNLRVIHQNCVYTCCTPLQEALAISFENELKNQGTDESYFNSLAPFLQKKRDFTAEFLLKVGMKPVVPAGGYFMLAKWTDLACRANLEEETDEYRDFRFTKWMCKNLGLQVIPSSAFYSDVNKHLGEVFIRFCFIKEDEHLEKGANILKNWTKTLNS